MCLLACLTVRDPANLSILFTTTKNGYHASLTRFIAGGNEPDPSSDPDFLRIQAQVLQENQNNITNSDGNSNGHSRTKPSHRTFVKLLQAVSAAMGTGNHTSTGTGTGAGAGTTGGGSSKLKV